MSLPVLLCEIREPRLRAALVLPRALWSGGSGFAAQGSGRALAPVHLVAPSLCPEKTGPGLCFLPRNFPGWPWNPACCVGGRAREIGGSRAIGAPATSQYRLWSLIILLVADWLFLSEVSYSVLLPSRCPPLPPASCVRWDLGPSALRPSPLAWCPGVLELRTLNTGSPSSSSGGSGAMAYTVSSLLYRPKKRAFTCQAPWPIPG
jgi:hypothetical protein